MPSNANKLTNIYAVVAEGRIVQINVRQQDGVWIASGGGIRGFTTSITSAYNAAKQFALLLGAKADDCLTELQLTPMQPTQPPPREPTDLEKFAQFLSEYAEVHTNSVRSMVLTNVDSEVDRLDRAACNLVDFVRTLIDKNEKLLTKTRKLEYRLHQHQQQTRLD